MVNKISPNIKTGIISSLIATVFFLYFLDPILGFLGTIFIQIGSSLFQWYIDRLYQEMAVGEMDYSYMWSIMLLFLIMITSSFEITRNIFRKGRTSEDFRKENGSPKEMFKVPYIFLGILILTCIFIIVTGSIKNELLPPLIST